MGLHGWHAGLASCITLPAASCIWGSDPQQLPIASYVPRESITMTGKVSGIVSIKLIVY